MVKRIIVDLVKPLGDFSKALAYKVSIPEYVLSEVVNLVFDVLIFELENHHEQPELCKLGNFYRDYLEPDPRFCQDFLDAFYFLLQYIAAQLRGHGFYTGDGFEFRPETNHKNRSIVVKKFDLPY